MKQSDADQNINHLRPKRPQVKLVLSILLTLYLMCTDVTEIEEDDTFHFEVQIQLVNDASLQSIESLVISLNNIHEDSSSYTLKLSEKDSTAWLEIPFTTADSTLTYRVKAYDTLGRISGECFGTIEQGEMIIGRFRANQLNIFPLEKDVSLKINAQSLFTGQNADSFAVNDSILFLTMFQPQRDTNDILRYFVNSKDSVVAEKQIPFSVVEKTDSLHLTFDTPGEYRIFVEVENKRGSKSIDSIELRVLNDIPQVEIITPDTAVPYGAEITLVGKVNACPFGHEHPSNYYWSFDTNTIVNGQILQRDSVAVRVTKDETFYLFYKFNDVHTVGIDSVTISIGTPQVNGLTVDSVFTYSANLHWNKYQKTNFKKYIIDVTYKIDQYASPSTLETISINRIEDTVCNVSLKNNQKYTLTLYVEDTSGNRVRGDSAVASTLKGYSIKPFSEEHEWLRATVYNKDIFLLDIPVRYIYRVNNTNLQIEDSIALPDTLTDSTSSRYYPKFLNVGKKLYYHYPIIDWDTVNNTSVFYQSRKIYCFDPAIKEWKTYPFDSQFLDTMQQEGKHVEFLGYNEKILIICNMGVFEYLPEQNKITSLAIIPPILDSVEWGYACCIIKDKLYAIGGQTVAELNLESREWVIKSKIPFYVTNLGTPTFVDGKIYVYGGINRWNTRTGDMFLYDPIEDWWSQKGSYWFNSASASPDCPTMSVGTTIYYLLWGGQGEDQYKMLSIDLSEK